MSGNVNQLVAAYAELASGDPSGLIDALDPEVEWWTEGTESPAGRAEIEAILTRAAGSGIEVVGIRKEIDGLLLEFTRPWWKAESRRSRLYRSWFDVRGELAVRLKNGSIARIDARERRRVFSE